MPRFIRQAIKPSFRWVQQRYMRLAIYAPFLCDVYYCFSKAFRREHRAVMAGKLQHCDSPRHDYRMGVVYTLRRNTHRLEKGLIMRPRRDSFALDYIDETVNAFQIVTSSPSECELAVVSWANAVLSKYFDVVTDSPEISAARATYRGIAREVSDSLGKVPYLRDTAPLDVSLDAMRELAHRRRSVRWYRQEPVPRKAVDDAIAIALQSPSACNRQPFQFRIFDDPQLASKVGGIPMGTRGFNQNFPCLAVVVGDLSAYFSERDRHVMYIDAGLASMAFQFALEVQGIASCCINWPDIEGLEREMETLLGLQLHERPIMCISFGYPDPQGMVPYSQKKALSEARSYNVIHG